MVASGMNWRRRRQPKQCGQRIGEFRCAASHAWQVTVLGPTVRAVTGPLRIRLVRQMAPSGVTR
jgi:hypothetical protein